jgi:integrase
MKTPKPRKLPSGSWFIQLRLNGVSVPVTASTARECTRQAELIKAEHRAGKREIQSKKDDPTLSDAIERYINDRRAVLSPSTICGYEAIRRSRFQSVMQKHIGDISNWQKIVNDEALLCSPKTLKSAYSLVRSVLRECGITASAVKLPQVIPAPRPWLTAEQIKVFVQAVKDAPCAIGALLALCSLRRSEILALTWENIDLLNNCIHVYGSAVVDERNTLVFKKTNKNTASRRTVPIMIPELRHLLEAIPIDQRSGSIIKCSPNTLWAQINSVCAANNLPQVGVHGLRHSFASLAYHLRLSEREAMLIGGWSDTQTMHNIYTHISQADKIRAENKLAEFFSD